LVVLIEWVLFLAIFLSSIALVFSAFVFVYNRQTSKRELLLRIHDQQLSAERQDGRRVLFELYERRKPPESLSEDDHRAANHALSIFNVIGFLYSKRYVPRRDLIDLWALTGTRLFDAAEKTGFLAMRDAQNGAPIWPYFRYFVADARRRIPRPEPSPAVEPDHS
jgi:hypothetical protein